MRLRALALLLFAGAGAAFTDAVTRDAVYLPAADLPDPCTPHQVYYVTNATSATDCSTTGGGTATAECACQDDGSGFDALSGGGGGSGDVTDVGDCSTGACFTADGTGTSLVFEGSTADAFETTLTVADPGADFTVTIPAETGTVVTDATYVAGHSDGANCSAGSYPLGVDASGAVESCTDATTEIDSAIATHAGDASAHHAVFTPTAGVATDHGAESVALTDLADGTDGELITWDATGEAATVAAGSSGEVLTSNGAGAAPTFQAAAGGGISNVVEDTTPQLGGQLDVNGNSLGDGTLEILSFGETASAVNQVTITNAAMGSGPTISATGDDTNIDLSFISKGSGVIELFGGGDAGEGVTVDFSDGGADDPFYIGDGTPPQGGVRMVGDQMYFYLNGAFHARFGLSPAGLFLNEGYVYSWSQDNNTYLLHAGADEVELMLGGQVGMNLKETSNVVTVTIDDALELDPQSAPPVTCAAGTAGTLYADSDSAELCFCTGSSWVGLVAGGACS